MKPYARRKLLVATIGVGTISYAIACNDNPPTSGNLPSPPQDSGADTPPTSGNLPAPPPMDAGPDSGEAQDGATPDGSDDAPSNG